jgi:hypothetical protein
MDPTTQRKSRNTTMPANIVASGGPSEPFESDLVAYGGFMLCFVSEENPLLLWFLCNFNAFPNLKKE